MITIWCTTIKTDIIPRIKRWILNGLSYHSNIDTIDISPSTVAEIILKEKTITLFMARNIFQSHAWFLFIRCEKVSYPHGRRPGCKTQKLIIHPVTLWCMIKLDENAFRRNVLPAGLEPATLTLITTLFSIGFFPFFIINKTREVAFLLCKGKIGKNICFFKIKNRLLMYHSLFGWQQPKTI